MVSSLESRQEASSPSSGALASKVELEVSYQHKDGKPLEPMDDLAYSICIDVSGS